jgi:alginate O-acetyltransferase complex protein AlgI
MLFNSLEFAIYLPLVFIIYWSLQRFSLVVRNLFLAAMSCVFYGWWDYRFLSLTALSGAYSPMVETRIDIYEGHAKGRLAWMTDVMSDIADSNGFGFLDLTTAFKQHYSLHGKRFNSDIPVRPHWNAIGNRVVARTVYNEMRNRGLLDTISITDTSIQ